MVWPESYGKEGLILEMGEMGFKHGIWSIFLYSSPESAVLFSLGNFIYVEFIYRFTVSIPVASILGNHSAGEPVRVFRWMRPACNRRWIAWPVLSYRWLCMSSPLRTRQRPFGCKLTRRFFPPLKQDVDDIFHDISWYFMLVLLRFDYDDHGVHAGCDECD